ncbi:unnamed protein product [Prorocentrum cordatum]|uniref:FHA domain-containing protein n=1 Tax=Prorocentrum cordatum TaxID=2364126 RepID=A0ABN9XD18_9DINO|nr:unnamed protein product [Polarella glacialis]
MDGIMVAAGPPPWFQDFESRLSTQLAGITSDLAGVKGMIDQARIEAQDARRAAEEAQKKVDNMEMEVEGIRNDLEELYITRKEVEDMLRDQLTEEWTKEAFLKDLGGLVKEEELPELVAEVLRKTGGSTPRAGSWGPGMRAPAEKSGKELERTMVIGGFERDSMGSEIQDGIKAGYGDTDGNVEGSEEILVRSRRSSIGFIRFKSAQGKTYFLTNLKEKGDIMVNGRRLWANDEKDEITRKKESSVATLVKELKTHPEAHPGVAERVDRSHARGIVWMDKTRVGEWDRHREEFKVSVIDTSKLNLGFSGEDIIKQRRGEMGLQE